MGSLLVLKFTTNVTDPPPSRLIALITPMDNKNLAATCKFTLKGREIHANQYDQPCDHLKKEK